MVAALESAALDLFYTRMLPLTVLEGIEADVTATGRSVGAPDILYLFMNHAGSVHGRGHQLRGPVIFAVRLNKHQIPVPHFKQAVFVQVYKNQK